MKLPDQDRLDTTLASLIRNKNLDVKLNANSAIELRSIKQASIVNIGLENKYKTEATPVKPKLEESSSQFREEPTPE